MKRFLIGGRLLDRGELLAGDDLIKEMVMEAYTKGLADGKQAEPRKSLTLKTYEQLSK